MISALEVRGPGRWQPPAADRVRLHFDDRHRRRLALTGVDGTQFLLDLPEPVVLKTGDGLLLEDGRVVVVEAAEEDLLEVRAHDHRDLVRFAWHLGNRHVLTQLDTDHLLIREDPVIAAMLRGLGADVRAVRAPFEPEAGAYAHGHSHD